MIKPLLQDDDFLADVRAARADAGNIHLWWLGQSGFLVQWEGRHLLLDPYLSDSLTHKYALTDKPHVRMTERVVAPERLNFINAVTSSHNHTDHLDQETLVPLLQANSELELVIPEANRAYVAERLPVAPGFPRGLEAGQSLVVCGFNIHGVPAAHNTVEKDHLGRHKYLGYIVQAGPWTIYHSGDTKRYGGMETQLQQWPVDVALLPINGDLPKRRVAGNLDGINGDLPERRFAGNLDGREAATLAKEIGARLVIPCHYDMFKFNTTAPEEFVATAGRLGQPYRVLRAGERWSSRELN